MKGTTNTKIRRKNIGSSIRTNPTNILYKMGEHIFPASTDTVGTSPCESFRFSVPRSRFLQDYFYPCMNPASSAGQSVLTRKASTTAASEVPLIQHWLLTRTPPTNRTTPQPHFRGQLLGQYFKMRYRQEERKKISPGKRKKTFKFH